MSEKCERIQVGYGRAAISPEEPCPLSGFGSSRTRISERVMDELYATCLAITDQGGNTVLLFACDQQRPQEAVIAMIREAVNAATGIPADKIIISASHSHSTPDLYLDMECIHRYHELLKQRFSQAAVQALADRKEASFEIGSMDTERLNFVKHYKQANGHYVGDNFGDQKESPIVSHASDAYGKIHVMRIVREGCKDIVIVNFRSHPTLTGGVRKKEVSSDFIGPLRESIAAQRNCDVVYFQGACGNIGPKSRIPAENRTTDYRAYGSLIAEAAMKTLNKHMRPVEAGKLQSRQIRYMCPIDHSRDHELAQAQEVKQYWFDSDYDRPGCMALCRKYDFTSVYHAMAIIEKAKLGEKEPVELDVVTIGDQIAFVTAPGELWDSVSVELEARSPFLMNMTLGYANGDRKYFPHGVGNTYRSYESDYARMVPGTADKIIGMWMDTLKEFYKNA